MTSLAVLIGRGLLSARPAAGTPGSLYYATDTAMLSRDNGASWDSVEGAGGLANPMTTAGDLIVGGASGTPARLAAATDGEVLTLVAGAPAWAAAGGGGGSTPTLLLDYALAADQANGAAYSAATWTDIVADQSFTVASAGSLIEIVVTGYLMVGGGAAFDSAGARLIVDSAGTAITKRLGGARTPTSEYANPLAGAGPVYLAGLAAGAHTVKPQFYAGIAGVWYLVAATNPNQHALRIQVIEHP